MSFHRDDHVQAPLRPAALLAALAVAGLGFAGCGDDTPAPTAAGTLGPGPEAAAAAGPHERYLYVATIAQSPSDPDFVAVVGADPERPGHGQIVNRVDMPNVGDELHHFGYSAHQKRLIVPGLFSNRIHVFDIGRDLKSMSLQAVNDGLAASSGYITPHSVIAHRPGEVLVTMIGAATPSTGPGGIVRLDDRTGAFEGYFGPGPDREADDLGPDYMYDFDSRLEVNRGISSAFGPPGACGAGIDPTCLGDEVAVWNLREEKVIQEADLGENNGALEVRFVDDPPARRAFINTPGTSAVWLAHDDDRDGRFDFTQVLGPEDGLLLPVDMLLSYDHRYMYLTNWFGNTVQQFDISDPFDPVLVATASVPHPNMLRLSPDGRRLYVSNSLITTWDDDPNFGPPRNDDYGIWLFDVEAGGGLASRTPDGSAWVSFENVQKKNTTGPAGPHMMLFDPTVRLKRGEH